jgi:chemotaxis protein MotB
MRWQGFSCLSVALSLALLPACGHTEQEWKAQLDKYNELGKTQQGQQAELDKLRTENQQLKADLDKQNSSLKDAQTKSDDLQKALEAAKQQATALDRVKVSFTALKEKLKGLTDIGLEVTIRHNKMVISFPGDVLFASGSAKLSKNGEGALTKVKKVLLADPSLSERYYQVAGHTDNQQVVKTAEEFKDNWGLSLMRAREVLLFLASEEGKGGLKIKHWSAAGYADTDPVSTNATPEGKRRNRRVELVLQPDVSEMLDLKSLVKQIPDSASVP